MENIYIYGASGHGLVVADIAKACGYKNTIFIDDTKNEYSSFDEIKDQINIPICIAIGDNKIRNFLFNKIKEYGFNIVSLVHPSAIISADVIIGDGTVVMPNVVINTGSKIGVGVIVNTSSVIEHENIIEDFVHLSPNVSLGGNTKIGHNVHIGISSCSIQGIKVGENSIIGAGSVIVKDIPKNTKSYGNPCKVIEEINE